MIGKWMTMAFEPLFTETNGSFQNRMVICIDLGDHLLVIGIAIEDVIAV